jgi:hypothetical protein
MRASSEAESRPRGRPALERGGVSPEGRPALERGGVLPEGAFSHRARQSFISVVPYPSSETEFRPRGAGADCSGGPLGPPGLWAPAAGS